MTGIRLTRRQVLRNGAGVIAAGAAGLTAPMVHAQGTGGTLRVGFWDHWVPASVTAMREMCAEWGRANRVEVTLEFITSVGNQLLLTLAAQAQARSGHDLLTFPIWEPTSHARLMEPVDDVVARLVQKWGPIDPASEYLGKREGAWRGVPATYGTQTKPPCIRFDLFQQHANIDIRAMWPARAERGPGADTWNWDTFLTAAERCHAAGFPFGLPMGSFTDAVDWVGTCMRGFGATMVDARGQITVRNNPKLRTAVEYLVRLARFLPNDVWAWDDGSNNRALISGRSALIFNPPSAWAVARRDAPQVAERCWYAPMPAGPEGRFTPYLPFFYGIWGFSRAKPAAKGLMEFLADRPQAEKQVAASAGYDIPPFPSMTDFKTWETEGPPPGMAFNYPNKPHQQGQLFVTMSPAPGEIAVPAYNGGLNTKMIARIVQGGESIDQALAWTERELRNMSRG
ncbi:MAG: extracellular solute-binding protein [Acetobacteraceae bacterium]|nr:extracellular solute-binding protein [Acetobacteraceae bacterium]